METSAPATGTGRIWGFTDEVAAVERLAQRALSVSPVSITVTTRTVIGSRGFFTRRLISQYEYTLTGPTRREVTDAGDMITRIAKDVLS